MLYSETNNWHDIYRIKAVLLKAARSRPDAARSRTTTAASNGKMPANQAAVRRRRGDVNISTKNSSGDEIANVNFLCDVIVHALKIQ